MGINRNGKIIVIHVCQTLLHTTITDLRFDQNKIDEQDDEIMFDIFVRESLAARTLRKTDSFTQRSIVGFAVSRVQIRELIAAFYTDWHCLFIVDEESCQWYVLSLPRMVYG